MAYVTRVEVVVATAEVVDHQGNLYPESTLKEMARQNTTLHYDEKRKVLKQAMEIHTTVDIHPVEYNPVYEEYMGV